MKLNDRWLVQAGVTAGHDVAPWTSDAKASGTACVDYTTQTTNDNFYLCANGINSAKFAYDNVQQYDATWVPPFLKDVAYRERRLVHVMSATCLIFRRKFCILLLCRPA